MASGECPMWREWVPLTALLEQLPLHFQQGVDTATLHITSIACLPKHLVLGTNVGLVYLAHLPTLGLMRLKCENPLTPVTEVSTLSTVDEMIAAGSQDGTISIFQLPRVPDFRAMHAASTSSDSNSQRVTLPQPMIKRFTVGNIHRTTITSLAWSRNGMRLFCGDAQGVVSEIEINYQTSECRAKELLREAYTIVQLSYSFKLLAVSTLERTLIFNLTDGSSKQVGKKPRKSTGVYGCLWAAAASQANNFLYASRPGLRLWSANTEGEVLQTHIIKELSEIAQIQLLSPSSEKPRKGDNFSFGILHAAGSYIVTYNPHWLFIVDLESLRVCNFSGQFGRIIGVAVSEKEIFVLDGVRHITCLSVEPPNIGERRPVSFVPGAFLEAENLKELKSRIVSQGSDILGQIARMSSTVAAKVTEHAKPSIVVGQSVKRKPDQNTSQNVDSEHNIHQSSHSPAVPTSISLGKENGHQRSSSSGMLSESQHHENTSNIIPPRMVQSVSSFFPTLMSTSSMVKTFGKAPLVNDITVSGTTEDQLDFEETVSSAQIVAQEGADAEPLVLRGKPKKKVKKKQEVSASQDIVDNSKHKSGNSDSVCNSLSPSPCPSGISSQSNTSTEKNSPENNEFMVEVRREMNKEITEGSNFVTSEALDRRFECDQFEGNFHLEGLDPLSVDTRTYEDFKSDIEKKESLLAEILDMGCLKMDHEVKSPKEKRSDYDFMHQLRIDRENSVESCGGCSTPSTLKEQSPLPEGHSNDFTEQYFRNNSSFTSLESGIETSGEKKDSSNEDNSCNCSIASNDGCERLGSNFSEDRVSCLSYGPPSGSSLVSLPGNRVPSMEGHDSNMCEPSAMFIVTDSSDIADISWSYSPNQVQEAHQFDQEQMTGDWVKHKLPSDVLSFSVSEKFMAFIDSHGCLFCKQTSSEHSWRKYKLTAIASSICQSPSGSVLWVQYGTNAYTVHIPSFDALPLAKMTLVARNVSQLCVDEELTWYIKEDHKVCAVPSAGGKIPVTVSCEDFHLVKIVCHSKVVWGLTDKGQVAFRIGMNGHSQTGHAWGVMRNHGSPVKNIALGPGQWGWIVDSEGNIYFRTGVCVEYPQGRDLKWWQIYTSDYMMEHASNEFGNVILSVSREGIWLTERGTSSVFFHNPDIQGHVWSIFTSDKWSTICAEGVYKDQGAICCLSPKGRLFVVNPNTKSSVPLEVVNNECLVSVSQRPEALWVLTAAGDIYIRVGLSAKSLLGTHWEKLDLHQISDVHLCHLSCGTEVVWAVDTRGGVYMRQGPLTPPPVESLPPAWIQVDATLLKGNAVFTKVYVGMKIHMVWAVDSSRRVYVREAIFPEIPIGISWVLVPGLLALQLSISENEVYALTLNGEVFKRTGVTEINYIGDTWVKIPGNLSRISVTTDNCLWGLTGNGQICHHESILATDTPTEKQELNPDVSFLSDESEDWEVL